LITNGWEFVYVVAASFAGSLCALILRSVLNGMHAKDKKIRAEIKAELDAQIKADVDAKVTEIMKARATGKTTVRVH
jgi:hypothetical protein